MKFYMPVKVYDEKDCVRSHASDFDALGKKALIVTGRASSFANGSFDDVVFALKQNNIEYAVFSDVEENPSTDTVFAAAERFFDEQIDFVIGIGGGSAMDAAKAIALVLKHPEADLDYLYDGSKDSGALPVVCVPTTCGTGSEVTGVSVLTRHDKKTKISMVHKVFPTLSLIDGKYLASADLQLVANSSVDALAHLYESMLSAKADDFVVMTATAGLKTWARTKDVLTGDRPMDENDRALLMRSSAMAGMSIAQSGTSLPHALSYTLTYDLHLVHGKAVGYFLPGFLAAAPEHSRNELFKLSGFAGMEDFQSFLNRALGRIQIENDELEKAFQNVLSNPAKMNSAAFPVDPETLRDVVYFRV